jgi:hypothetical protein
LGQKDSALNQKFRALFEEAKAKEPQLLTKPDWPLVLADRAVYATLKMPPTTPSPPSLSFADVRAMEQAMTEIYGHVLKVDQDGCLLRVSGFSGGPWIARRAASAGVSVSPITIYVEGLSGKADGEQFQDLPIYPTGQFQKRGSSTLRQIL